jgi:VWFA-related protein
MVDLMMRIALRFLIFVLASRLCAQDVPTLAVNVNVVSVLATVHDQNGRIVKDLKANDFVLEEDGVPQQIRYFSRETGLPLTVGLLVDTSRSQEGVLGEESVASSTFLNQVLREGKDQAFVVKFDTNVDTLQSLTSSRTELADALARLTIPEQYATLIYSAVRDSAQNITARQAGRKAFILLTDGVAYKDPTSIGTAIEFAQRADTILYSIRISDSVPIRGPIRTAILATAKERGKQELHRMARETGGAVFEVKNGQTLETIYAEIEDLLRSQYNIGYTPGRSAGDGKYHKIKLVTKDRHLIVDSRDGYFAK